MLGRKSKLVATIGCLVAATLPGTAGAQDDLPTRHEIDQGISQFVFQTDAQRVVLMSDNLYDRLNPKKKIGPDVAQSVYSALFVIFDRPRGQVSRRGGGESVSFKASDDGQYWILLECGGRFVQSDFFDFNPVTYTHREEAFFCVERPGQ